MNIDQMINYFQDEFSKVDEETIKNTSDFQIRKLLRDKLVEEGFSKELSKKIVLTINIDVSDNVFFDYENGIKNLVSSMASVLRKIYDVYQFEFDVSNEDFLIFVKNYYLKLDY